MNKEIIWNDKDFMEMWVLGNDLPREFILYENLLFKSNSLSQFFELYYKNLENQTDASFTQWYSLKGFFKKNNILYYKK